MWKKKCLYINTLKRLKCELIILGGQVAGIVQALTSPLETYIQVNRKCCLFNNKHKVSISEGSNFAILGLVYFRNCTIKPTHLLIFPPLISVPIPYLWKGNILLMNWATVFVFLQKAWISSFDLWTVDKHCFNNYIFAAHSVHCNMPFFLDFVKI